MASKETNTVARHPRVVMLYDKVEDVGGTTQILSMTCQNYKALRYHKETPKDLARQKPSILFIAMSNVNSAMECYAKLLERKALQAQHSAILLCNKRDATAAFHCCISGVFDDYFVHQPLYEKLRLVLTIQQTQQRYYAEKLPVELDQDIVDKADNVMAAKLAQLGYLRDELTQEANSTFSLETSLEKSHDDPLSHKFDSLPGPLRDVVEQLVVGLSDAKLNDQSSLLDDAITDELNFDEELIFEPATVNDKETSEEAAEVIPINNKILVVEDNSLYRDMLVSVLKTAGFETEEACDGLVALNKIKQNEYCVIMMDLFMPNLDGLNTTKQLRLVAKRKDTPIVALTGNTNKEVIRRWASYGLKGYIIKPSNRKEILASVGKALDLESAEG